MNDSDARFEERLIDGQVVTIPSAPSLQEISRHPDFLGAPVYLEGTRRLVTDLLTFVTKHPDTFRLGMTRSKGLRSWTVLPLLLIGERLQRVHIEQVTCGQCGRRPTIANPSEPSLYFGVPDRMAVNRAALKLPRVNCPNCGASLPEMAVWAEFPTLQTKYTKHQVARSAKPDGEKFNVMYLIKNVQKLRATYQIRLLAFRAVDKKMKLVLRVPASCEFDSSLQDLIERCGKAVFRENM